VGTLCSGGGCRAAYDPNQSDAENLTGPENSETKQVAEDLKQTGDEHDAHADQNQPCLKGTDDFIKEFNDFYRKHLQISSFLPILRIKQRPSDRRASEGRCQFADE